MRDISIIAETIFFQPEVKAFSFPIVNSVRISFWIVNSKNSTWSEIEYDGYPIEACKLYKLRIILTERDFLEGKIKVGTEFILGTFPNEVAHGRIIEPLTVLREIKMNLPPPTGTG